MTFRSCLRKVFKIYKNGLESKLDDELSRNESQIETYFDSVCISKSFMVLYAIDHSVLRVRYKKQAGDKLNCTPFVRQYDILSNKWGVLLCQKEYQTNDIRRNSKNW